MPAPSSRSFPLTFSGDILAVRERSGKSLTIVHAELSIEVIGSTRPLQYALRYKRSTETSHNTINLSGASCAHAKFSDDSVEFSDGCSAFEFRSSRKTIAEIKQIYEEIRDEKHRELRSPTNSKRGKYVNGVSHSFSSSRSENCEAGCSEVRSLTDDDSDCENEGSKANNLRSPLGGRPGNNRSTPLRSNGPCSSFYRQSDANNIYPAANGKKSQTSDSGWYSKLNGPVKQPVRSRPRGSIARRCGDAAYANHLPIENADEDDENASARVCKKTSSCLKIADTNRPTACSSNNSNEHDVPASKRLRISESSDEDKVLGLSGNWDSEDLQLFGFRGLRNVGNSCYLNAVLQALFSLHTFTADLSATAAYWCDLLVQLDLVSSMSKNSPRTVIVSLQRLLDYRNGRVSSTALNQYPFCDRVDDLKDGLAHYRSHQFSDYAQKDAQELLCMLLEAMERELLFWSRVVLRKQLSTLERPGGSRTAVECNTEQIQNACLCANCSLSSSSLACINVKCHNPAESNFVYAFNVRSSCANCGHEKCNADESNTLLLNLVQLQSSTDLCFDNVFGLHNRSEAAKRCATLQDLIDWFAVGEHVQMDCEQCGERNATHSRRRRFVKLPRVLLVVALRYRYDKHGEKLVQRFLVTPFVTLARFVDDNVKSPVYQARPLVSSPLLSPLSRPAYRRNLEKSTNNENAPSSWKVTPTLEDYCRPPAQHEVITISEDEDELQDSEAETSRNLERIRTALSNVDSCTLPDLTSASSPCELPSSASFGRLQDAGLDDDEALRIALQHSLADESIANSFDLQELLRADLQHTQTSCVESPAKCGQSTPEDASNATPFASCDDVANNDTTIRDRQNASCVSNGGAYNSKHFENESEITNDLTSSKPISFSTNEATLTSLSCGAQLDGADALRMVADDIVDNDLTTEVDQQSNDTQRSETGFKIKTLQVADPTDDSLQTSCDSDQEMEQQLAELRAPTKPLERESRSDDSDELNDSNTRSRFSLSATNACKHVALIDRETDLYTEDAREFIDHVLQNGETGELPHSYRLVAVVSHRGSSLNVGHYVSDVYSVETQRWTRCDDSMLSDVSQDEVLEQACLDGYIFFYTHCDILSQVQHVAAQQSTLAATIRTKI